VQGYHLRRMVGGRPGTRTQDKARRFLARRSFVADLCPERTSACTEPTLFHGSSPSMTDGAAHVALVQLLGNAPRGATTRDEPVNISRLLAAVVKFAARASPLRRSQGRSCSRAASKPGAKCAHWTRGRKPGTALEAVNLQCAALLCAVRRSRQLAHSTLHLAISVCSEPNDTTFAITSLTLADLRAGSR
jgi:hypothetical protein